MFGLLHTIFIYPFLCDTDHSYPVIRFVQNVYFVLWTLDFRCWSRSKLRVPPSSSWIRGYRCRWVTNYMGLPLSNISFIQPVTTPQYGNENRSNSPQPPLLPQFSLRLRNSVQMSRISVLLDRPICPHIGKLHVFDGRYRTFNGIENRLYLLLGQSFRLFECSALKTKGEEYDWDALQPL